MRIRAALMVVCSAGLAGSAAAQSTFRGIGDIVGGGFYSEAGGVSSDGRTVVGWSESATGQVKALRWFNGQITTVGDLNGGAVHSEGYGIADNGVVVGQGTASNGLHGFKNHNGRFRDLPPRTQGTIGACARWVTPNGQTTVGSYEIPNQREVAVLWVSYEPQELGFIDATGTRSRAYCISDDAAYTVGWSESINGIEAFKWDGISLMTGLGDLPGGAFHSEARAISRDGLVVVGYGTTATGTQAFRWTEGGGMVALGDLPGGDEMSVATAINGDGSVVVGYSSSTSGVQAFIWDAAHGMRALRPVLAASQANVAGWTLLRATGVSAAGDVVVGTGRNPSGQTEGWTAKILELPPCPPDFNGDGFLDFFDVQAFIECFEGSGCPEGKTADYDGDEFVDFFDVEAFLGAFEAGC